LTLWANLGPPRYQITAPAEVAPYYAVIAGVFLTFAAVLAGYGLLRRRVLAVWHARIVALVVAGCVSAGWVAAWVWQHAGRAAVLPTDGVWNFAVELPDVWFVVLAGFLVVTAARLVRWCSRIPSGKSNPPTDASPGEPPGRADRAAENDRS
jgi:hypothetical protein